GHRGRTDAGPRAVRLPEQGSGGRHDPERDGRGRARDVRPAGRGHRRAEGEDGMTQKITTFLMFKEGAEEAVRLYTSVFADSRIVSTMPGPDGKAVGFEFEIAGQRLTAYNGGPTFSFAEGMSLFVSCDTQKEIDDYTAKLIAGGGEQGPCGWIKD